MLNNDRVRRAERIIRRIAGRFDAPRDEAFVGMAEAAYAFLVAGRVRTGGAGGRTTSHHEPRINRVAFSQAERAFNGGDMEAALEHVEALHRAQPDSLRVLRLRRDIQSRRGDLSGAARSLHRMHVLDDAPERFWSERLLLGRIIETEPGWTPRIPGAPRPVTPDPDVVLHLLKESVPYHTNGFTMRSRYNLIASRDAGLKPVVVTQLGFPRAVGAPDAPAVEMLDEIPHHRLDLGPDYPLDQAWDLLLEDQAWLTARVARQVRPAIIHAGSGHRGYESALVGAAVRAHIRRPMVYEVRSFFEATWSADPAWNERGEQYHRRYGAESAAMAASDHVITIAESMRADIIGRGVDPARVTVIPNGVDANAFRPEPPDPELQRRYGTAGRFAFGYVSNLDHPRENQELLVEAAAILLRRGRKVTCLIIGDGRRRAEVEAIAKKAGTGSNVVFTGRVPHEDIRRHYALLDAFVVPRRDERAARTVTPLKPYEALAMARPLVVADLPALTEIAEPELRGLAFAAGDAEALAAALERLMDNPELGRRMGEVGREWVARERTWAANGPRFREVYDEVTARWDRDHAGEAR
ncbi:MAG: glycosyltransferase family 4 protein [Candidatus Limnocylindrales bacterium]